jgi:sugar lactone lactonase YvrE
MKKYFIVFVSGIVMAGIGCKKYNQQYNPPTQPPTQKKWVVTTMAGEGTASFVNGPELSATFHFPGDVAVTPDGTIYVTDVLNFCVRRIVNGGVSNFAGGSGSGIVNGIGPLAQFKNPYSVTLDGNGNLYTSDENDPRIRKISPTREVSVYAGIETPGFADGNSDTSRFFPGNSIVADAQGNVYVADAINNRIRKISLSGVVSTIAGSGTDGFRDGNGTEAQFSFPGGIAIDRLGNLYVADRGNFRIRKITPGGQVSTLAGTGVPGSKNGSAAEAEFSAELRDIVIDGEGNLYLIDFDQIREISLQGIVSTLAGSSSGFRDGDASSSKFNFPAGLGIDAQGTIYVADLNNNRIRKISFE